MYGGGTSGQEAKESGEQGQRCADEGSCRSPIARGSLALSLRLASRGFGGLYNGDCCGRRPETLQQGADNKDEKRGSRCISFFFGEPENKIPVEIALLGSHPLTLEAAVLKSRVADFSVRFKKSESNEFSNREIRSALRLPSCLRIAVGQKT